VRTRDREEERELIAPVRLRERLLELLVRFLPLEYGIAFCENEVISCWVPYRSISIVLWFGVFVANASRYQLLLMIFFILVFRLFLAISP